MQDPAGICCIWPRPKAGIVATQTCQQMRAGALAFGCISASRYRNPSSLPPELPRCMWLRAQPGGVVKWSGLGPELAKAWRVCAMVGAADDDLVRLGG